MHPGKFGLLCHLPSEVAFWFPAFLPSSDLTKMLKVRNSNEALYSEDVWLYENTPEPRTSRKHSGLKNFVCTYCLKRCCSQRDLDGHVNARHLHTKPFSCERCSRSFSHKTSYNFHKRGCWLHWFITVKLC